MSNSSTRVAAGEIEPGGQAASLDNAKGWCFLQLKLELTPAHKVAANLARQQHLLSTIPILEKWFCSRLTKTTLKLFPHFHEHSGALDESRFLQKPSFDYEMDNRVPVQTLISTEVQASGVPLRTSQEENSSQPILSADQVSLVCPDSSDPDEAQTLPSTDNESHVTSHEGAKAQPTHHVSPLSVNEGRPDRRRRVKLQNTLKQWRLSSIWLLLTRFFFKALHGREAIVRNRSAAILAACVHLPPIFATITESDKHVKSKREIANRKSQIANLYFTALTKTYN
jgi:hypothetical protein